MALLYQHCRADNEQLKCVADSESLIARMLYGRAPAQNEDATEKLSRLAKAVAESEGQPLSPDVVALCKVVAHHVDATERGWAGDMQNVVQWMRPGFSGWDPFSSDRTKRREALDIVRSAEMQPYLAAAHVIKARLSFGVPVQDPNLDGMANAVLEKAGASISIYRSILEQLVTSGWDPTKNKRTNSLWDMQVVLGVGEALEGGLAAITLITSDRGILNAAAAASRSEFVMSLASYLTCLQI
jgi:hypothetical protein